MRIPSHDPDHIHDRTPVCGHVWGSFYNRVALYRLPVPQGPVAAVCPRVNRNKLPCRQGAVLEGSMKPVPLGKLTARAGAVERGRKFGNVRKIILKLLACLCDSFLT